jgi:hypothetical protein
MAAQKGITLQVSLATHKRVKAIKNLSGVSINRLADLGMNFFCAEVQRGTLIIQNGQILLKQEKAT